MLKFALIAALVLGIGGSEGGGTGGNHKSTTPAETPTQPPQPFSSRADLPVENNFGNERITNYASDITVEKNGQLDVTETIAFFVTGDQIHHGIYRDFPTRYKDRLGANVHVRFDVTGVKLDGKDVHYTTEGISNGVEVKIGDADTEVEHGSHVYAISYITSRQIGFFKDYDELYWNVTGNGWNFQIDHAEATIHLPPGARIKQSAYYTGAQGEAGTLAHSHNLSDTDIKFETTNPLPSYNGLTVAVGFAKGAVAPPSAMTQRAEFIRDNASPFVAGLGAIVLLIFYITVWWEYGRDPPHGTIIPLFEAPKGFSAPAVRYLHRMAYDRKAFAAALISMAVKGYMKIEEDSGKYTLTRTGKTEIEAGLSGGEKAISSALFSGLHDSIELKQTNHSDISSAITGLKTSLKNEYERKYFVTNQGWFFGGIAILAVTGIAAALLSEDAGPSAFLLVWLSGWSVGTAFILHRAFDAWADVINGPGSRILNIFGALFMTLFAIPFTGGLIFALFEFGNLVSPVAMVFLIAGGAMAYIFYHLLKAPTLLGTQIRDQIDGFRIYLSTAEKDRLEVLNPPAMTPEVFEKCLPYAIALDCENTWSKRFTAEAAAAGRTAEQGGYTPIWYSGSSFSRLGTAGFASAIGTAIATSAASASTAPGSSSGSGGGGFSGGGGGGGGGGGW